MSTTDSNTITKESTEIKEEHPPMYACVLLNDDYTSFEFVIMLLMQVFNKTEEQAVALTVKIHHEDEGVAGVYPLQIAEFKRKKAMQLALEEDHPLQCILRKA